VRYEEHVAAVEREVAALAHALGRVKTTDRVPSCPDWTVADLAKHLGEFCGFWTHVVCEATGRPKTAWEPAPSADLEPWFSALGSDLVTLLRSAAADTRCWTWKDDDQTAAFIARRCANELAVHRFDAQLVCGQATPIDAELAIDGIDEMLMIAHDGPAAPSQPKGKGETLHLHGTDTEAEWFIALDPGGLKVEKRHEKADFAARASVSDLELLMFGRPTLGEVQRFGDESALQAWYRSFTF
jgi:uncharacterized protein (TIGR03083 family)